MHFLKPNFCLQNECINYLHLLSCVIIFRMFVNRAGYYYGTFCCSLAPAIGHQQASDFPSDLFDKDWTLNNSLRFYFYFKIE